MEIAADRGVRPARRHPGDASVAVASRSFSRHARLREALLERYSDVRFNETGEALAGDALVEFASERRRLIVGLEVVDEEFLARVPALEVISKYGVGLDSLDLEAMARRGVRLGWTGGVNRRSVAELALGFMLSLLRLVPETSREIREGGWQNRKGRELTGKTVGIVGCGNIGKDVVQLLGPFSCRLLAHDLLDFPDFYRAHDVEPAGLDELLSQADIVTLHLPLDAATRNLFDERRLRLMRPGSILVNTARGGIVDEVALATALRDGVLAGAGFDVFATEPPEDRSLVSLPNFLATPHVGGSTEESILALWMSAIRGLDEHRSVLDYPELSSGAGPRAVRSSAS